MNLSPSVELLWQIAGQEAIAAQFGEIEPEHFLAALFKFAELPIRDLDNIAPRADVVRELRAEVDAVRGELETRSIDSTRLRRELRALLGKGDGGFDGEQMHRSPACREFIDVAARLADDAGSETLTAIHLLEAALTSPTPLMQEVLGKAVGPRRPKPAATPLIDECGNDLVSAAAAGRLPRTSERPAEAKALIRLLADSQRRSVFMVTDSGEAARSVVATAAATIAGSDQESTMGRRIVDVTGLKPVGRSKADRIQHLEKLLGEASAADEVILFVPPIEAAANPNATNPWADLLKKTLIGSSVQCICQATPMAYKRWLKKDYDWKRQTQVMWIEESGTRSVPLEL